MKLRVDAAGLHIFDRASGLNVVAHELTFGSSVWATAPRFASVALLNACDLSCPYCYAPKHGARLQQSRLRSWLKELDVNGCLGVGFGGGEPTLRLDLADLCHWVAEETEMAVSLTTHGHRFSADLAASLRGAVNFVRVSVDGVGATYERLRGRPFDDLRRVVDLVASVSPFGINVVVNEDTIRDLDEVARFAVSTGATQLLLLPEVVVGDREGIDEGTRELLRSWVATYHGQVALAISANSLVDGLPYASPFPAAEDHLVDYVHITADGFLKPSSFAMAGVKIEESGILPALDQLRQGIVQ